MIANEDDPQSLLWLSETYNAPLVTQIGMGGTGRVIQLYIDYPYAKIEKKAILSYMRSGYKVHGFMAFAYDYIAYEHLYNVSISYHSDGKFVWVSDLIYYVEKYDFRLPRPFLEHMAARDYAMGEIDIPALNKRFFSFLSV